MKRLIAFDIDSTLLRVESLDTAIEAALSRLPDATEARKRLHDFTNGGMTGRIALRDSLEARLKLAALDRGSVIAMAPDCPLSRNGGKAEILNRISTHADTTIIVGDGMTDFEAFEQGAADRFIGFGAIAQREVVLAAAEWSGQSYVRSVNALAGALKR